MVFLMLKKQLELHVYFHGQQYSKLLGPNDYASM
jgi:hypothetical protein